MLFPHKILLVVPDTKEPVITANQQRLMRDVGLSGIPFVPLLNGVTVPDVINELKGGAYDIVMFLAHTFGTGVQLTPGEVLEPAALGAVARFGLKLVVLLSCESYIMAQAVAEAADVDVIATIQALDSDDAWRTGTLLVQSLRDPAISHEDAFLRARPGVGQDFVFIPAHHRGGGYGHTPVLIPTAPEPGETVTGSIVRLDARIDGHAVELARITAEHASTLKALNRFIASVETRFQSLETKIIKRIDALWCGGLYMAVEYRVVFVLAFLLLFMPIPLLLEPVQQMLGFSWLAALLVAIVSYLLSAALWGYMWWGGRKGGRE